jgi:uncharacterized protein (DUF2147 family)
MKKLYIVAALLMATTAAQAGNNSYSFEVGGRKIHIEAPKNCESLSCIKVSGAGLSGTGFKSTKPARDDDTVARTDAPVTKTAATPVETLPAPQPQASNAPAAPETIASTTLAPAPVAPSVTDVAKPAPVAAAPASTANTPLGVWATEENKGTVRIEACGDNLCGVAAKTGEKILINMKPSDAKWTGRIHDPDSGRTYDSVMTMKGSNTLKIQGCAFGGMFCGGQTWTRIS